MSRFATLKSSKSAVTLFTALMALAVAQAPVACATPDDASPGFMSDATEYCEEHEPDLGIYCTDVYEASSKEKALSGLVSEYCSWIDRRAQNGWAAPFRIDQTANGPAIVSVSFTQSMAEMSEFYDRVRTQGILPDSAPKSFDLALSENNWWREGCWVIN